MNDKVCYICPHCYATLFVDKAKEVSGVKWCPNCGNQMHMALVQQEETVCTDTEPLVAWNEEWTRQ